MRRMVGIKKVLAFLLLSCSSNAFHLTPRVVSRGLVMKATVDPSKAKIVPPKNFVAPEPKPLSVHPELVVDVFAAAFPIVTRVGNGALVLGYKADIVDQDGAAAGSYGFVKVGGKQSKETSAQFKNRPKKLLKLYEFQGCPFCQKVREAVTILDLDVLFLPCPKNGIYYRPEAVAKGGKSQFPYLVDENTGVSMYESDDIISYLFDTYGDGSLVPSALTLGFGTTLTCGLGLAPRLGKGSRASLRKGGKTVKPIELWGYELSPFCRLVKEVLNEYEIPHIQRTCPRGSPKRDVFYKKYGNFQVPYIEDPNTGISLFESFSIIQYLKDTYALQPQG